VHLHLRAEFRLQLISRLHETFYGCIKPASGSGVEAVMADEKRKINLILFAHNGDVAFLQLRFVVSFHASSHFMDGK